MANCTSSSNSVDILTTPNPVALVLTGSTICSSPGGDGIITSTTSEIGVNYQLYDGHGIAVRFAQAGTGAGLIWSGINTGIGYRVIGINGASCTSFSNDVDITTMPNPSAGITNNTGSDILTCSTTAVSVTAIGGNSYLWSGGNSLSTDVDSLIILGHIRLQ